MTAPENTTTIEQARAALDAAEQRQVELDAKVEQARATLAEVSATRAERMREAVDGNATAADVAKVDALMREKQIALEIAEAVAATGAAGIDQAKLDLVRAQAHAIEAELAAAGSASDAAAKHFLKRLQAARDALAEWAGAQSEHYNIALRARAHNAAHAEAQVAAQVGTPTAPGYEVSVVQIHPQAGLRAVHLV